MPRLTQIASNLCVHGLESGLPQEPLDSFAFITDEPSEEVRNAGHDRCIVPFLPENVMPWLTPTGRNLDDLDQMLADRERPYYEHQLLAA